MSPRQIVYFIVTCLLLLGLICIFFPQDNAWGLRWPTLANILAENQQNNLFVTFEDSTLVISDSTFADTLAALSSTYNNLQSTTPTAELSTPQATPSMPNLSQIATSPTTFSKKPISPASGALELFKVGLQEANTRQVRVVHYGDSQIEEGRITYNLRQHLQAIYGGSGIGWLPIPMTTSSKTTKMTITMNGKMVTRKSNLPRYTVYGHAAMHRTDNNNYGAVGQVTKMDTLLCEGSNHLHISIQPLQENIATYPFSQLRIIAQGDITVNGSEQLILYYPDSTTGCQLDIEGQGDLFGISLESSHGVILDNVPMRGSIGNVFTKMDTAQLAAYYQATNTRLIILQYGGNLLPGIKSANRIYGYVKNMRAQVRCLRQCAPQASIVFVGPSDMLTTIDGVVTSYPYLELLDYQLAKMASEEGIGYWSLLQAMGGIGGMQTWQDKGWAASDGVHFSHQGANRAGELLWEWLEKELNLENDEL